MYLLVCFAFVAIFVGVVTEFLLEKHLPQLPYTVALFVEGMAVALVHVWTSVEGDERHVWSRSLHMWLHIDPHVLLFAFLPLLLFGDASLLVSNHVPSTNKPKPAASAARGARRLKSACDSSVCGAMAPLSSSTST